MISERREASAPVQPLTIAQGKDADLWTPAHAVVYTLIQNLPSATRPHGGENSYFNGLKYGGGKIPGELVDSWRKEIESVQTSIRRSTWIRELTADTELDGF